MRAVACILCALLLGGCASTRSRLGGAEQVRTRCDRVRVFGSPDHVVLVQGQEEWHDAARRFNLFRWRHTAYQWTFVPNGNGQVVKSAFSDLTRQYRLFPRRSLPAGFEEFK